MANQLNTSDISAYKSILLVTELLVKDSLTKVF